MSELRRLITGFRVSQAVHVAAVLGISDLLADGPLDVVELARRTGSHERSLYRLLRALAAAGVYRELDGQRFESAPLGDELRTDAPTSAAGQAAFIGTEAIWRAWAGLLYSVRTGENAFRAVHGQGIWEYRAQHPADGAAFDESMTSISRGIAEATLDAYDFGRFGRLVDVGGGRGGFLGAILARYPSVHGVLFDQAHVLAGAPSTLDTVAGSFFEEVPAGADAYLLKFIIHDWPDEESAAILRVIRRAMTPESTLVLVERVIPSPNEGFDATFADLNMLVGPGGQERTEAEYAALFAAAGFTLTRVVPTRGEISVIEGRPASSVG